MVVHCLDGYPSSIKEKIDTRLSEETLSSEDGITTLLTFLESIYVTDEMGGSLEKQQRANSELPEMDSKQLDMAMSAGCVDEKIKETKKQLIDSDEDLDEESDEDLDLEEWHDDSD